MTIYSGFSFTSLTECDIIIFVVRKIIIQHINIKLRVEGYDVVCGEYINSKLSALNS